MIPYGKTTMKIEAHWSVIKRHYLQRFNQPRLDLLIWTLLREVMPAQKEQFSQIRAGIIEPHWWVDFKKEWTYAGANNEERARLRSNKRKRIINIGGSNSSYFTEVA